MSVTPIVPTPALVALGDTAGCLTRWPAGAWPRTLPWPIAAGTLGVSVTGARCGGFSPIAFAKAPAWQIGGGVPA